MSDAKAIEPTDARAELQEEIERLHAEIRELEADAEEQADKLADTAAVAADFTALIADVMEHCGPLPLALRMQAEAIAAALGVAPPRHRGRP